MGRGKGWGGVKGGEGPRGRVKAKGGGGVRVEIAWINLGIGERWGLIKVYV